MEKKSPVAEATGAATTSFTGHLREGTETLLATALVPIHHPNGERTIVRALIDQGSTSNFISEKICQVTLYQRHSARTTITSLNGTQTGKTKSYVNATVGSIHDPNYRYTFDALVVSKVTSVSSIPKVKIREWKHIEGLELADPKFHEPGDIDLLIGTRAYSEIILSGLKKDQADAPIAQLTKFGWVLSGACATHTDSSHVSCNLSILEEKTLSKELQQFWALEQTFKIA